MTGRRRNSRVRSRGHGFRGNSNASRYRLKRQDERSSSDEEGSKPGLRSLLERYFRGSIHPGERRAVDRWAAKSPSNRRLLEAARKADRTADEAKWNVDRAWRRAHARIEALDQVRSKRSRVVRLSAAAVL